MTLRIVTPCIGYGRPLSAGDLVESDGHDSGATLLAMGFAVLLPEAPEPVRQAQKMSDLSDLSDKSGKRAAQKPAPKRKAKK